MQEQTCPHATCDGSGWILNEETNTARPCACRTQKVSRALTDRIGTGIPKRFHGVAFDRNPVRKLDPMLTSDVRRFADAIGDNLAAGRGRWFYGGEGTGKTALAMLISKAALEAGYSVAIYSMPHLLASIKETYEDSAESSYMELFRGLCEVDLLHLDDLGAERRTDWVLEQLYSIVNERWQNQRSITVTTNMSLDNLREQVGRRTVSRLVEICGDPIPVMGQDLRIEAAP
jgi:DNA replication protein DnaC